MRNWKIPPNDSCVVEYIDCYWLLQKRQEDLAFAYPKLNPDPAAHFILAGSHQPYQYSHAKASIKGYGSHWIFSHCKTFLVDHSQPFLIMGIKFQVGALYSLKLSTPHPALDQVISEDLGSLLNLEAFNESDFFANAIQTPEKCRDVLDEILKPWLLDCKEDRHSLLIRKALLLLSHMPISEMGHALSCSQRTIERSFLRVTGLTLKQYQSMNNLEVMLNYLFEMESKHIDWSDIAAQFGFSDQPHLIRYLKKNIGTTPGRYAKQRDLTIDVYGNFESSE